MILAKEQLSTAQEQCYDSINPIIGIGAIVIPKLLSTPDKIPFLTVQEIQRKIKTGKFPNHRGIPQETIKVDPETMIPETRIDTLQALILEELLGISGHKELGSNFHLPRIEPHTAVLSSLPGREGRIEVVIFDGAPRSLLQHVSTGHETTDPRYVSELLPGSGSRQTSVDLYQSARSKGLLKTALEYYSNGDSHRLFNPDFNPSEFLSQRSRGHDIIRYIT